MFFEGTLQSGIALALQQGKQVVCFVQDDGEESKKWEHEYLADEEVSELLKANSVALRLAAGSQEAGFLASFCPINKIPTLVSIKNGLLQEYIISGTAEDEFKTRLKAALARSQAHHAPQIPQAQTSSEPSSQVVTVGTVPSSESHSTVIPEPEALQEEETAADRQKRENIRQGKKREASPKKVPKAPEKAESPQKAWRQQQLNREKQAKSERDRVLALINHDREERKAKLEQQRLLQATPIDSSETERRTRSSAENSGFDYRLQVRLFDGSSIRSKFSPTHSIHDDVRPWIDSQRTDGNAPYTLKQILTPLPNKTISISEEDQTLKELGLGPTANLVMVPIHDYTEAYSNSESSLPVRGLYAGYNLVSGALGTVTGAVSYFLGIGQGQPSSGSAASPSQATSTPSNQPGRDDNSNGNSSRPSRTSNVRTLRDHRDGQGTQHFYNGNQLNFEPRRDRDKED